jgi:hypothetical protein
VPDIKAAPAAKKCRECTEETWIGEEYLPDPDHHLVRDCFTWTLDYDDNDDGQEEEEKVSHAIDAAYVNQETDNQHVDAMFEWIREHGARGRRVIESKWEASVSTYRLAITLSNIRREHMRRTWVFARLSRADHEALLRMIQVNLPSAYRVG